MSNLNRFRILSPDQQALVAIAVLIDGHDAVDYLLSNKKNGLQLSKVAQDVVSLPIDLRLSLMGTLLRESLEEMKKYSK